MKVLIIGGHGTIGKKVSEYIKTGHQLITAGRNSGDIQIDLTSAQSIQAALEKIKPLDAIVCIAGEAKWAPSKN